MQVSILKIILLLGTFLSSIAEAQLPDGMMAIPFIYNNVNGLVNYGWFPDQRGGVHLRLAAESGYGRISFMENAAGDIVNLYSLDPAAKGKLLGGTLFVGQDGRGYIVPYNSLASGQLNPSFNGNKDAMLIPPEMRRAVIEAAANAIPGVKSLEMVKQSEFHRFNSADKDRVFGQSIIQRDDPDFFENLPQPKPKVGGDCKGVGVTNKKFNFSGSLFAKQSPNTQKPKIFLKPPTGRSMPKSVRLPAVAPPVIGAALDESGLTASLGGAAQGTGGFIYQRVFTQGMRESWNSIGHDIANNTVANYLYSIRDSKYVTGIESTWSQLGKDALHPQNIGVEKIVY